METTAHKSTSHHNSRNTKLIIGAIIGIIVVISALVGIIIFSRSVTSDEDPAPAEEVILAEGFDYSWLNTSKYIAHAFGGIFGHSYTNSYEAFLLNYQLGHRVFEVDFALTEDGIPVLQHDAPHWHEITDTPTTTMFSYDNFRSKLIYDGLHGVDCEQLITIMAEHPDIYIVTDTKYTDQTNTDQILSTFVEYANKIDPSVLDRFIIQIYNEEMFDWVMAVHPWKSIIYTLYNGSGWTPDNVLAFSERTGVKLITIPSVWLSEEVAAKWSQADINIAVHTLNDLSEVKRFEAMGVDSIYTDFLIP